MVPPAPEATADATATDTTTAGQDEVARAPMTLAPATASLPGFGLPVPGSPTPQTDEPAIAAATTLAEIDVDAEVPEKPIRTWETRLAPSIIPTKTRFNYRRQVLPDAIYRTHYSRENAHLPTSVSREYYVQLLFNRVAANDVNATRALLNRGIAVNITDTSGMTALDVARRYGASDTARLLRARGAS